MTSKNALLFAAVLPSLGTVLGLCLLPAIPIVDSPNHLARAYIIHHLANNPLLAQYYQYQFTLSPYILGDLALAGLLNIFSPFHAARIWAVILFFSLPTAWIFYLHSRRSAVLFTGPVFLALLYYLSLNYFFLTGYNSHCLSVAFCFLAMALWERWQAAEGIRAALWYGLFCAAVAGTYLSHLAGFFFAGIFLAALVLSRILRNARRLLSSASVSRAIFSGAPFFLFIVWHRLSGALGGSGEDTIEYLRFVDKILGLGAASIRYYITLDAFFLLLFLLGCFFAAATRHSTKDSVIAEQREMFLLVAVSLILFFVLPYGIGPGLQVDLRAIQFTMIFFLTYAFSRSGTHPLPRWATVGAAAFALANLAAVTTAWIRTNERLVLYQHALEALPTGKKVLPVYTWSPIGRFDLGVHQSDLYAVVRSGFSPDVFSNSNSPGQFPYFSFRTDGYTPGEFWYVRNQDSDVDWERIEKIYDYLVITKPYVPERIRLKHVESVFENDAISILSTGRMRGNVSTDSAEVFQPATNEPENHPPDRSGG